MKYHILTNRIAPFHTGGLENSIFRIAKTLRDMGHDIHIYITDEAESEIPSVYDGIHYYSLCNSINELLEPIEDSYKKNLVYFRTLYHIMLNFLSDNVIDNEQDVLFSFYISTYGFIQQRVADSLNIKHVAFVRGSDYAMDMHVPSKMSSIQYVCNNCSLIVATNYDQIRNLVAIFNLSKDKFKLCYNPVEYKGSMNISSTDSEVLFISDVGYSWKKGTHILFKAFERLCNRLDGKFKLYICGPTAESEKTFWEKEKARLSKKYPENIIVDGYSNTFDLWYSKASAYVFPSLAEGCSNALLKALVQNMTVITTETGFMPELKDELDGVYCVKPADSEALFQAMLNIAESPVKGNYENRISKIKSLFSAENERETLKEIMEVL